MQKKTGVVIKFILLSERNDGCSKLKKKSILISKNQNQTKLCSIQKQISYILKLWFYFHGSKQINLYVTSFIHDPYVELKYSRCFTITLQVSKKSLKIVQKNMNCSLLCTTSELFPPTKFRESKCILSNPETIFGFKSNFQYFRI